MKIYGTDNRLLIEDEVDSEGELEAFMQTAFCDEESIHTWLNKESAIELIKHLTDAFNL